MKPLVISTILLLLWAIAYYVWDSTQFHETLSFGIKDDVLVCNQSADDCSLWLDFYDSYSFVIKPTDNNAQCGQDCCMQLHMLYPLLDNPPNYRDLCADIVLENFNSLSSPAKTGNTP